MTKDSRESQLLRIAACTTADELLATLSSPTSHTLDSGTLVTTAACTIPATPLLKLAHKQAPSDTKHWTQACVDRALSLDTHAGRIDWAISWLEHTQETCDPSVGRLLACARLVQALGAPSGALRELCGMRDAAVVEWSAARVHDGQTAGGCTLVARALQQGALRSAWTVWALEVMDGVEEWRKHVLRRLLLAETSPEDASRELRLVAVLLGVCDALDCSVDGDARRMPGDVLAATVARDARRLARAVGRQVEHVEAAVQALSQATHVLHGLRIALDVPQLVNMLADPAAAADLLKRVAQSAGDSLARLQTLGLFAHVPPLVQQQILLEHKMFAQASTISPHTLSLAGRRAAERLLAQGDYTSAQKVLHETGLPWLEGRVLAAQQAKQAFGVTLSSRDTLSGTSPGEVLDQVLRKDGAAYRRPGVVRELARLLALDGGTVAALLVRCAVRASDWSAAYEMARKAAREQPSVMLAAALAELAERWDDKRHSERRVEVASLALRMCPAGYLHQVARTWQAASGNNNQPGDVMAEIVRRMTGESQIVNPENPGDSPVDVEQACAHVRSMDPAIVRRALRGLHGASRARALLEWTDYAADRQLDAPAQRLQAQVQRALVADHAAQLCEHLAARLSAHNADEHSYALYARAADALGRREDAGQARVRARLAAELPAHVSVARLVHLVLEGRLQELGDALGEHVGEIAECLDEWGVQRMVAVDGEGELAESSARVAGRLALMALARDPLLGDPPGYLRLITEPQDAARARALVAYGRPHMPLPQRRRLLGALRAPDTPPDYALGYVDALPQGAEWTHVLDEQMTEVSTDAGLIDAEEVGKACFAALEHLVRDAYALDSLKQAYRAVDGVCKVWGARVPELAEVYGKVLADSLDPATMERVAEGALSLAQDASDDGSADALRLCVLRLLEERSNARMQLLQLCERYRVTVDANVHLHVLAQDLWHDSVGVDDIRRDWGAVWRRLLAATAPADTRLVELLAERLHAWRKEGSDDQREACWAELLVWCVRSNNSLVLVGLLQKYTAQFTAAVGALAFDQLLPPPTSESVEHVAALGVAGLAFPHNTWAETCVEQVVLSTLASSIPAQVLGNRLLHLGIVRHAFLPAFLSSAELLHAIGRTLLTPPPAEHSAAAEGYMLQGCGRLELLRRAVHVLMHVGLPALALEWTAVVLAAPAACVLPEHAGRWLAQLDCVVLGRQQVEHEKEVSVQQVEQEEEEDEEGAWGSEPDVELDLANDQDEELDGWGDDVDLDAHGEMEHGVAADVLLDNEEDAAWGDDDDIDLDAALNDL